MVKAKSSEKSDETEHWSIRGDYLERSYPSNPRKKILIAGNVESIEVLRHNPADAGKDGLPRAASGAVIGFLVAGPVGTAVGAAAGAGGARPSRSETYTALISFKTFEVLLGDFSPFELEKFRSVMERDPDPIELEKFQSMVKNDRELRKLSEESFELGNGGSTTIDPSFKKLSEISNMDEIDLNSDPMFRVRSNRETRKNKKDENTAGVFKKLIAWTLFIFVSLPNFVIILFNIGDLKVYNEFWIGLACALVLIVATFPRLNFISGSATAISLKTIGVVALAIASINFAGDAIFKYEATPKGKLELAKSDERRTAQSESYNEKSVVSNPPAGVGSSMTSEQRRRYENMSPAAKAYVDRELRKYDAVCKDRSDC